MILTNLRADTRFLVFGDSSNTQYGDTDLDRNLNRRYHELIEIAMSVNGDWQVRGTYATLNLEAGVNKYDIPNDIVRFNRAEIKPLTASTAYIPVSKIDMRNIHEDLGTYQPSDPEYDIRDNKLEIYYDTTLEAVTNGLKIWLQREITELSASADEPDLPEFAHRYLTVGAGYDYCVANGVDKKAEKFKRDLAELVDTIKKHYANRLQTEDPVIIPQAENFY